MYLQLIYVNNCTIRFNTNEKYPTTETNLQPMSTAREVCVTLVTSLVLYMTFTSLNHVQKTKN